MNAMEKVAWTELVVCVTAVTAVTLLLPWVGDSAITGFALLGLMVFGALFIRRRDNRVVVDERDREIERKATSIGVSSAWMTLFLVLIAATTWSGYSHIDAVPIRFLNWLIWIQFAICYGIKGLAAILMYRRQHAA
ncbi:MAG: DUF2178 domain-containing protein [Planctomycetota bacterium]